MISTPASVVVILLLLRGTDGDSVDQTKGHMTLTQGAALTINCTYEISGYPNLFWYVQYPKEALQLLLSDLSQNEDKDGDGFHAENIRDSKSFHLSKRRVDLGDSAVYYCAVSDTVTGATGGAVHKPLTDPAGMRSLGNTERTSGEDRVEQTPPSLSIQAGENSTMNCSYKISGFNSLQWYRQDHGKGPISLFVVRLNKEVKSEERFTVLLNTDTKHSFLNITASQPGDSATYFCAGETQ
ncbi:uncharacterized protein LOC119921075 [Tachyglossus aculeatus]|uniref:uncharacterized protein LOC119921075 n=1 Tax=Tachyglossus aculeatus TaxID=9261 RepID=UPI0018F5DF51|nr:uncharacterized protein LOC119921075 [Tachyglossus aculeatus]